MITQQRLQETLCELDIKTQELGPTDAGVLALIEYIANLYYILENYEDAITFYEKALAIKLTACDHLPESRQSKLELIDNFHKLGVLNRTLGKFENAEDFYSKAYELTVDVFGPEHLSTATQLNFLAGMYFSSARYAEAESKLGRSLEIYMKCLGPRHLYTSFCHLGMSLIVRKQGRIEEAEDSFSRAEAATEDNTVLESAGSGDLTGSLNLICQMYMRQKRFDEAEVLFRHILFTEARDLWPDNPVVADGFHTLAELYLAHRLDKQAAVLFRQALDIYTATLPDNHAKIARTAHCLARLLKLFKEYDLAKSLYEQVITIKRQENQTDQTSLQRVTDEYISLLKEKTPQEDWDERMTQIRNEILLNRHSGP